MNVWLLLMGEEGDYVLGPFTSVQIDADVALHTLTGRTILRRNALGWSLPDSSTYGDRFVVQQGGWDSPWGERGRRLKVDA